MSSTPTAAFPQRLTTAPGIDTVAKLLARRARIVFESDRSGAQQLYVMDADGSGQRRISFGGGALRLAGVEPGRRVDRLHPLGRTAFGIGVMSPTAANERMLTNGWRTKRRAGRRDSRVLVFQRIDAGRRDSALRRHRSAAASRELHRDAAGRRRPELVGSGAMIRAIDPSGCVRRTAGLRAASALRLPATAPTGCPAPAPGTAARRPGMQGPVLAFRCCRPTSAPRRGRTSVYFGRRLRYVLTPQAQATLAAQARWLIAHPVVRASIEGHADERGRATMRWRSASAARAGGARLSGRLQGVPAAAADDRQLGQGAADARP